MTGSTTRAPGAGRRRSLNRVMAQTEPPAAGVLPDPEYTPPPASAIEHIAAHLAEHEISIRLERDVSFLGNPQPEALISYVAAMGERAQRYHCAKCPGRVFLIDPVDPVDLRSPEERQAARTREEVQAALAELGPGAPPARRGPAARDPKAARREELCQQWMLARYRELGNREEVWDELEALPKDNPELWQDLAEGFHPLGCSTLQRYWKRIPQTARDAAKADYRAIPERERNAAAAARRKQKLTG